VTCSAAADRPAVAEEIRDDRVIDATLASVHRRRLSTTGGGSPEPCTPHAVDQTSCGV
jgi:hypothetical protein